MSGQQPARRWQGPLPLARRIRDDQEALQRAREIAAILAPGAAQRDQERRYPEAELEAFSASGLWAISVPQAYGGAGVSYKTVARVFTLLAAADPSVAQLAQGHTSVLAIVARVGTQEQKHDVLGRALAGYRLGTAGAEPGAVGQAMQTRISTVDGQAQISGQKFFSTGALLSHWVAVYALDEQDRLTVCLVDRQAPGLLIEDDWHSFGQRTTASGTLTLDQVPLEPRYIIPAWRAYADGPQNAVTHITHAAIDCGILQAAIDDSLACLRERYGTDLATVDGHILQTLGGLQIGLHGAQGLLDRAGDLLDSAIFSGDPARHRAAEIAVYEAKVQCAETALRACSVLFELVGARATFSQRNLDRHWRNARTHTVHDPVYLRQRDIGRYWLGEAPLGQEQEE
ncbi:acyl-CoA dehydrogenase family protein [Pseudomonas typographi]|uniref:acyl-CoA dehydrogenase family protein n=1 Tax=Pseudomonas typographi TaxID=2715964 RepID=UPI001689EFFF|nr:SfnB family sulfur acquisition oxidoreductase [Pseudomonas typographi]